MLKIYLVRYLCYRVIAGRNIKVIVTACYNEAGKYLGSYPYYITQPHRNLKRINHNCAAYNIGGWGYIDETIL